MTNAKKYGAKILAQECKTGDWAIEKQTGNVRKCRGESCENCLFDNRSSNCAVFKTQWLNAEYGKDIVLKREFSESAKLVIRALDKINWVIKDEYGGIWGGFERPRKTGNKWVFQSAYLLSHITTANFYPISCDDKEPTSRKEILGEEE